MASSQYSTRTSEEDNDTISVTVHLTIYEQLNASESSSASLECSTNALEASIIKGGTVADLKAVLESQDLIPERLDNQFTLEVRINSAQTSCLEDIEIIHDSVKDIFVTLKPTTAMLPCFSTPTTWEPCSNLSQHVSLNASHSTSQTTSQNASQNISENTSHNVSQNATQNVSVSLPRPAQTVAEPLGLLMNNFLMRSPNTLPFLHSLDAPSTSYQNPFSEMSFGDPASLQEVMNSSMMRSLMSNSDILRSILESNPQIRQLREQHPELNHLLNDSEVLQQSMQAMQNPGLMQEMISNTDRVLNNIDAVPGGYNTLRRVYQSIQEPIWDVSLGRGASSSQKSYQPRYYNLNTSCSPSTDPIPNPWATNVRSCSNSMRQTVNANSDAATRLTQRSETLSRATAIASGTRQSSPIPSSQLATPTFHSSHTLGHPAEPLSTETQTPNPELREPSTSETHTGARVESTPECSDPVLGGSQPSTLTPSLPCFYPHIFTNSRRLRSLGGFSLSPHIQGVLRPAQPKEDDESGDDRPLPTDAKDEKEN